MGAAHFEGRPPREAQAPASLRVSRSLTIPLSEIEWKASPSGGPGGQHANRASSRVEVRFDVVRSGVLGPRQRAVLLERFGTLVTAVAGDDRSQARNREIALARLASRLEATLRARRARRLTTPTPASRNRRLEEKRRRSATKKERVSPSVDDS